MNKALLWLVAVLPSAALTSAQPQGTAFTYQGRLTDGGAPAAGTFDFQFALYDSPAGGSQVGPIVDRDDVVVAQGLFTLSLDFGTAAFAGNQRYLDLAVRPGTSTGVYTPIGGRQELTPAPSATFSARAPWSGISGKPAGFEDDDDADTLGGLTCANGQIPKWGGTSWFCSADAGPVYTAGGGLELVQGTLFIIADGGVTQTKIADGAVVESKLASASVTGPKLANGAVDTVKLADLAVTTNKIQLGAVTTAQIAQGTIAFADISQNGCALNEVFKWNGAVWGCGTDANTTYTSGTGLNLSGTVFSIADDGVTTPKLASGAVTTAKLAGSAVTSAQIADGAIALADIGANGCLANQVMKWNGGAWACAADVDSGGDITDVTAGAGLTGGAVSGPASLAVSFGGSGASGTVARSDHDHGSTYSLGTHDHMGQTWTGTASAALSIITSGATGLFVRTDSTLPGNHALFGLSSATTGASSGVHGRAVSASGTGVLGEALATGLVDANGVTGHTASSLGAGVIGRATATGGIAVGVRGITDGFGAGIQGIGIVQGILGQATGTDGVGIHGIATANDLYNVGVQGDSGAVTGRGVYGHATAVNGTNYGVYGQVDGRTGKGVMGISTSTDGLAATGVRGEVTSSTGKGVYGIATAASGVNFGIYGETISPAGYAGYFEGDVEVTGVLTRPAEALKIDHPLDPENKYLQQASVASPDMKTFHDGVVVTDAAGYAEVELPSWFEAANRDFRYQLTVLDEGDHPGFVQAKVVGKIADGRFAVRTSAPHVEVSWLVTGIRRDRYAERHRIVVEKDKGPEERGTYLHPADWDQPAAKGLAARRQEER